MGTTDGEELDVRVDRGAHRRGTRGAGLRAAGLAPGLLAAVITAVALVLAGCASLGSGGSASGPSGSTSSGGDQTDSSSGGIPDQLGGRTFLSTSVDGHDLASGSHITITFGEDGTLSADAGCNSLSGPYRLDDGRLIASQLAQTEMGCEQALMDQDTWFAGLLASGLTVDVQGDGLTLTGKDVTMQLTDRRVVDPDRPLQGTTWVVDGIITGTGDSASVSSVPQGITATLRIADGKIHLLDGLNGYDGPEDPGGTITIGPESVQVHGDFAGSGAGCASGATCSVDMSLLTHDFDYQITAGHLTVTGTGQFAGHGLMFTAQDAGATNSRTPSAQEPPAPTGIPDSPGPSTVAPSGGTGAPGGSDGVSGSATPARPGPTVSPGTASGLTSSAGPRPTLGRHDSVPPQPAPRGGTDSVDGSDPALGPGVTTLPGHTFRLTGLFTDAGGADTKFQDARFTLTFGPSGATAESSCGTIYYPHVRYYTNDFGAMVDLGDPTGPSCTLGSDPAGVPAGQLMVSVQDGKVFLSTGFVGWWFEPVG